MPKLLNLQQATAALRLGNAKLMKMHTANGMAWFVVPGGPVNDLVANALLKRIDVKPSNDGLFPGVSQTWMLGWRG